MERKKTAFLHAHAVQLLLWTWYPADYNEETASSVLLLADHTGHEKDHCPEDWLEAFFMLEMHLQNINDGARQVIFFDELPWMDTPKSGFITGFEAFWNGWACHRNVMLIVAGSVTSSGFRIN